MYTHSATECEMLPWTQGTMGIFKLWHAGSDEAHPLLEGIKEFSTGMQRQFKSSLKPGQSSFCLDLNVVNIRDNKNEAGSFISSSIHTHRYREMQHLFPPFTHTHTMEFNHCRGKKKTNKLHGPSPRANYTDRATAACRRSDCQLLWIERVTWSAWRIPKAVFSVF
jgi:hypothetical protein